MKHMNVVQLRQSLGKAVHALEQNGEPIVLDSRNRPVAVIISLKDFRERFVEKAAEQARWELMEKIDSLARPAVDKTPVEKLLRDVRDT